MQVGKPASKGSTLALESRADITRSPKQGYQMPLQKGLMSSNFLKKTISAEKLLYIVGFDAQSYW